MSSLLSLLLSSGGYLFDDDWIAVKDLITHDNSQEKDESNGRLPLHYCVCYFGPANIIKDLLVAYPDSAKEKDCDGRIPLHHSMGNISIDVIQTLLEAYPDGTNEKDCDGRLAIHIATKNNATIEIITALLSKNPLSAGEYDNDRNIPIHYALQNNASENVINALLSSFADGAKVKDRDHNLPIHYAFKNNYSSEVIQKLLSIYPDGAKEIDNEGFITLHYAFKTKVTIDLVDIILNSYPDGTKQKDFNGNLPLHHATKNNATIEIITALLSKSPLSAGEYDNDRNIPIHYALQNNASENVINALLSSFADGAKVKDRENNLPIHYAFKNNYSSEVIQKLLSIYPDGAKEIDNDGSLPIHYALKSNVPEEVIYTLLSSFEDGAKVKDRENYLPLHYAYKSNYSSEVIQALNNIYPDSAKEKDCDGYFPVELTFQSKLLQVVRGNFDEYGRITSDGVSVTVDGCPTTQLRYFSSYKLNVFVSSTFTDTHTERNILLDEIVPMLKAKATPYGIQLVFVDMRYGVRDENTLDHMTWIACKKELNNSMSSSSGLYFLSLQSSKYGYQPIPKYIPQDLFEERYATLAEDEKSLVDEWYFLDNNNIPPRYVLKNLNDVNDPIFWSKVLPNLRNNFNDIEFDDNNECRIGRSVTEWEAKLAIELDINRIIWIARKFESGVNESYERRQDYNDTYDDHSLKLKLDNLLAAMQSKLEPLSRFIQMEVPFDNYIANDDVGKRYLDDWKEQINTIFIKEIDRLIARKRQWLQNSFGLGFSGNDVDEMVHHCKLSYDKCSDFTGREKLIEEAMEYIVTGNSNNQYSISLCLIGVSGSGKTALISKLASVSYKKFDNNIPVVVRYCGTSAASATGINLIKSISKQIELLYGLQKKRLSDIYIDAVQYFHSLLSSYPVILLIDSLDQLSNDNQARSKITFLDGLSKLHKDSRIIVSALPDEKEKGYFYLCDTNLAKANVTRLIVSSFEGNDKADEACLIISSLLSKKSRKLSSNQMKHVMEQVKKEPTALYIRLAIKVVEEWTSFVPVEEMILTGGVTGIINQIFESIERHFGKLLVQSVFGLITYSVGGGLSINHIQDLLSLDNDVVDNTFQYSKPTKLQIPLHVILRLYQTLEGLVVEREEGKINWYHRQLKEAASARYKGFEHKLRVLMAVYFGNLVDANVRNERLISQQPLVFGEVSVYFHGASVNKTSCLEGVTHMLAVGNEITLMLVEAYKKLCDLEYILGSIKVGLGFNLVLQLIELDEILTRKIENHELVQSFAGQGIDIKQAFVKLRDYKRWLVRDMSSIVLNSNFLVATGTLQPIVSTARKDIESIINGSKSTSFEKITMDSDVWYRGRCIGGPRSFDSCLLLLTGHLGGIMSVCFSHCGKIIASSSGDIRIWNIVSGLEIQILEGHSKLVRSISFSSDDKKLVSGGDDKTLRLWDIHSGNEILKIEHNDIVSSVCFSQDDKRIVSGCWDSTISVWNSSDGELLLKIDGHVGYYVTCVDFSNDDSSRIVSGGSDKCVRVWSANDGTELLKLEAGTREIMCVRFSNDGKKVLSSCSDRTILVFDASTGSELIRDCSSADKVYSVCFSKDDTRIVAGSLRQIRVIDGINGAEIQRLDGYHGNWVQSVAYGPDGTRFVSASGDKSIRIWDANLLPDNHDDKSDQIMSIAVSGSRIAAALVDKSIRIFDAITGLELKVILGHTNRVTAIKFIGGTRIVSGSWDSTIRVWDANDYSELLKLEGHDDRVLTVDVSSKNTKIASGSEDKTVRIWNADGIELHKLLGHSGIVNIVVFSPDGETIASGSDDCSIRVWSVTNGLELFKLEGNSRGINALAFDVDGTRIASGSLREIKVWDTIMKCELLTIFGHTSSVTSIQFTPDNCRLISGSDDFSIRLWDSSSGQEILKLDGHTGGVTSVLFADDDDDGKIISASRDKTIRIYDAVIL